MSTEVTPLKNSTTESAPKYALYGNVTGIHQFYAQRRKKKQLHCLTYVIMIAIVIMALVATVSYFFYKSDPLMENLMNPELFQPSASLKLTWMQEKPNLKISNEESTTFLTTNEWRAAVKAGQKAITSRIIADALSTPLPAPSPNSRHQYAVKTSIQAGKLALGGIGELAATRFVQMSRVNLGKPSLMGSYFKNVWVPIDTCKEFYTTSCSPRKYRNFDGTCNHPKNFGAALTPFIRKMPADYSDGVDSPRIGKFGQSLPSAREISLKVHPPAPSSNPAFTVMLAVFGQFLDHDITATAISQGINGSSLSCCPVNTHAHPECFPVEVGPGDPVFDSAGKNCMEFVRSAPAPQCKIGPREQLNQVTAFIDGSVIYGPDHLTAEALRKGQGGLLRMFKTSDNRTLLPQSTNSNDGCNRDTESARGRYCFASGDGRANENLHLTTMHLLWARQHNKVAEVLTKMNPKWNDETIYQEARRIIGAQLQHIAYNEFLPIVIGEKEANLRKLKPLSSGFRPKNFSMQANPAIANSFAAAAFRFAHTLLPGLMKVADSQKTTSSYMELHRMLFNPYSLYAKGGMEKSLTMATSNSIQKTTTHVTSQLTNHLFEDPLANNSIPCGLDLVSLNIQRGRDHGLPGYMVWRKHCGLSTVQTFDELRSEMDVDALEQISKLYDHVDDIDLYTGALAENNNGDGLVGPTFKCLIGDQFSRIQQGDRFWYEVSDEPQSFTEGQLKEIRKTTLAKLICDCSDEIYQVQSEVMRSVSAKNPILSCEDLPAIDLSAWKDASLPILNSTGIKENSKPWLDFQNEIETSIEEFINQLRKISPAPKRTGWAKFMDFFNKSFTEIWIDLLALHPNVSVIIRNSSSHLKWKNEFDEKLFDSELDMKLHEFAKKGEKLDNVEFWTNRPLPSSADIPEPATTYVTYEDWMNLKNDITIKFNDALVNATGIPNPEQRNELIKYISTALLEIKTMMKSTITSKLNLENNIPMNNGSGTTPDWLNLKNDLVKAVTDSIDRIQNEAPPSGDSAWKTYGAEIKKQFANIVSHIPSSLNNNVVATNSLAMTYVSISGNLANVLKKKSITKLDGKILAPGDLDRKESSPEPKNKFPPSISNSFIHWKDNLVSRQSTRRLIEHPAAITFWKNFSNTINKSIRTAVAEIAEKQLLPNGPILATSSDKILNDFSKFEDNFFEITQSKLLQSPEPIIDPVIASFWKDFRNSLNASMNIAYVEITGTSPPAGDSAWEAFSAKIMNTFAVFKEKFVTLHVQPGNLKEKTSVSGKFVPFDWYSFKSDIIHSVIDTVKTMKTYTSLNNIHAWAEITTEIINEFRKIPSDVSDKTLFTTKTTKMDSNYLKGKPFDWISFKNEITQLISEIFNESNIALGLLPEHSKWENSMAIPNDTSTGIKWKSDLQALSLDVSQFSFLMKDWADFKEKVNNLLVHAIGFTTSNVLPPVNTSWACFRDSIKDKFAILKNAVAFLKFNSSLQARTVLGESTKLLSDKQEIKLPETAQSNQHFPELISHLIPPQEKTNEMFIGSVKTAIANNLTHITPLIPVSNWISFKQDISTTMDYFLKKLNGTDTEEWKEAEDLIRMFFTEFRKEILSFRHNATEPS